MPERLSIGRQAFASLSGMSNTSLRARGRIFWSAS